MSTTMVKISTLASAVDTPEEEEKEEEEEEEEVEEEEEEEEEALSPPSLSFRDKLFDPFTSLTSKSISPQGAVAMVPLLRCSDRIGFL